MRCLAFVRLNVLFGCAMVTAFNVERELLNSSGQARAKFHPAAIARKRP